MATWLKNEGFRGYQQCFANAGIDSLVKLSNLTRAGLTNVCVGEMASKAAWEEDMEALQQAVQELSLHIKLEQRNPGSTPISTLLDQGATGPAKGGEAQAVQAPVARHNGSFRREDNGSFRREDDQRLRVPPPQRAAQHIPGMPQRQQEVGAPTPQQVAEALNPKP